MSRAPSGSSRAGFAQVPMVVGWLAPVVLVPAAAFTALSPDQLRSLLAHELAHIRRHDHLFNAVQAVVEVVLFFHPVVWWISKQLRVEREYCCDDSSVRVVGDPRLLAEALAAMERLRITRPTTSSALAADGGPLMQRITRILGVRSTERSSPSAWQLPAALALVGVLVVAGHAVAAPGSFWQRTSGDESAKTDLPPALVKIRAELEAAVKAGKLTPEAARERFESHELTKVWHEIQAAVKTRNLSHAQALERFEAYMKRKSGDAERLEAELRRVEEAVKSGELSPEEGKKRMKAIKARGLRAQSAKKKQDPQEVIRRIEAAVEAGEITPAEGKAKIEAYRERVAVEALARRHDDPAAALAAIKAEVEAGKLTPAQGKARIAAYEKLLAERRAKPSREEAAAVIRKIRAAVEAGKLTPEEGEAKINAYRIEIAAREVAAGKEDAKAVLAKLEEAVKKGELTQEQAKKLAKKFEESLAKLRKKEKPQDDDGAKEERPRER